MCKIFKIKANLFCVNSSTAFQLRNAKPELLFYFFKVSQLDFCASPLSGCTAEQSDLFSVTLSLKLHQALPFTAWIDSELCLWRCGSGRRDVLRECRDLQPSRRAEQHPAHSDTHRGGGWTCAPRVC